MSTTTTTEKRILLGTASNCIAEPPTKKTKKTKAAAGPKKLTQKAIKDRLKYSTKAERTRLLKAIFAAYPHVVPKVFEHYSPYNEPIEPMQPPSEEPLLQECFNCGCKEGPLRPWNELMSCSHCCKSVFDKTTLKEWFGFTNKEADKMKRTSSFTGMYGGIKYHYGADTVAKALKKKHGSLFTWLVGSKCVYDRNPPCIGQRLEQATKKPEKTKIVNKALQHSRDNDLADLVYKTILYEDKLKLQDSLIGAFSPAKLPS